MKYLLQILFIIIVFSSIRINAQPLNQPSSALIDGALIGNWTSVMSNMQSTDDVIAAASTTGYTGVVCFNIIDVLLPNLELETSEYQYGSSQTTAIEIFEDELQIAIDNARADPNNTGKIIQFFFPEGDFNLHMNTQKTDAIQIPEGVVLKGAGANKTRLHWTGSHATSSGFKRCLFRIHSSFSGLECMTISGRKLSMPREPLKKSEFKDYRTALTSVVNNNTPFASAETLGNYKRRVGPHRLESLVRRCRNTVLILIDNGAKHSWVKNCRTHMAPGGHILISSSEGINGNAPKITSNITIHGNQIQSCWTHTNLGSGLGGGGIGFGGTEDRLDANSVGVEFCLIENNIIRDTRHGVIVQDNATNNVIAYNDIGDTWTLNNWGGYVLLNDNTHIFSNIDNRFYPFLPTGDIQIHGDCPSFNLIEGNKAKSIMIDNAGFVEFNDDFGNLTDNLTHVLYRNHVNDIIVSINDAFYPSLSTLVDNNTLNLITGQNIDDMLVSLAQSNIDLEILAELLQATGITRIDIELNIIGVRPINLATLDIDRIIELLRALEAILNLNQNNVNLNDVLPIVDEFFPDVDLSNLDDLDFFIDFTIFTAEEVWGVNNHIINNENNLVCDEQPANERCLSYNNGQIILANMANFYDIDGSGHLIGNNIDLDPNLASPNRRGRACYTPPAPLLAFRTIENGVVNTDLEVFEPNPFTFTFNPPNTFPLSDLGQSCYLEEVPDWWNSNTTFPVFGVNNSGVVNLNNTIPATERVNQMFNPEDEFCNTANLAETVNPIDNTIEDCNTVEHNFPLILMVRNYECLPPDGAYVDIEAAGGAIGDFPLTWSATSSNSSMTFTTLGTTGTNASFATMGQGVLTVTATDQQGNVFTISYVVGDECEDEQLRVAPIALSEGNTALKKELLDNRSINSNSKFSARAFPNPLEKQTTIEYKISQDRQVSIIITNTLGQVVKILEKGNLKTAGRHKIIFNKGNLMSGIYFCRIKAGEEQKIIKLVIK